MDDPALPDDVPSEQEWSDPRFLELARNGGQDEAYRLLFPRLTKLRWYLTSRYSVELGGAAAIEEVVHEAAWKAIESVFSYRDDRGGVLTWAFMIGVNHAVDQIRSDEARHARERSVARREFCEPDDLYRTVCEAIACLPDPFRTVLRFDLERGEGCSRELAERFRVQPQTIYNWRVQAHAMIEPYLR